jgi:hypothetical protein
MSLPAPPVFRWQRHYQWHQMRYPRPPISLIVEDFPGWGMDIYIGGSSGVSDVALLAEHDIGVVINCAVNLDIDWVSTPKQALRRICCLMALARFAITSWADRWRR